jgi:saccharopine dehydrogenase (NAD+, L-lysine-forming)
MIPISKDLNGPKLRIIAIDLLPTLIAGESNDKYSGLLLPSLLSLNRREKERV